MTKQEEIERQKKFIARDEGMISHYEALITGAKTHPNNEDIQNIIDMAGYIKQCAETISELQNSIRHHEEIIGILARVD